MSIELNTKFDPNLDNDINNIIKLYPSDDNFTNYNLYQVVDDCNYRSYILETDKYWYLVGNAFS